MIKINGESLKDWNKRVNKFEFNWDTSKWVHLPDIKTEGKMKNKKRIKELELQVDALTNALSNIRDLHNLVVELTEKVDRRASKGYVDKEVQNLLEWVNMLDKVNDACFASHVSTQEYLEDRLAKLEPELAPPIETYYTPLAVKAEPSE